MISLPLHKIQNIFQTYLTDQNPDSRYTIRSLTVDTAQISATRRLEIYYDGYRLRLLEILAGDFPKLRTLMGDAAFDELGHHYIAAYPSKHFSIRYFGQHFARFLHEDATYAKETYLAEMASFEWALGNTFDAKNVNIATLDNLKSIPPEQWSNLKIHFHPSLQTCVFEWNIPQLWKTIENKEIPCTLKKQKESTTWIFWRRELQSQFRSLTNSQELMLQLFQENHRFGDICESLSEIIDPKSVPVVALGFIQQCIEDGFLSEFSDD